MPATALIINADDLGLWPSVDAGIMQAWQAHAISESSVLANSPRLPEILRAARESGLPVGIHLNLTHGLPLSDPADIPDFVTPQGTFMKRVLWPDKLPIEQIRLELRSQLAWVLQSGCRPTHLDSHHHIHRYPEIFAVTLECARELGVPVRAIDAAMRDALRQSGIVTTDHFSMDFYGEQATVATLIRLVEECPGGTLEIMTHPGHTDTSLPSSYREERERELAALCAPAWQNNLTERQIPLINFSDLHGC